MRTKHVQDVLDDIAALKHSEGDSREPRFNVNSLKHMKSFLSGVFRLALQRYYEGPNPVRETSLPQARRPEDTYVYSLEEILTMMELVPEPGSTVIATAGFTGARRGEIRGMFWENYRDGAVQIARSKWNGHVTDPESAKSKGAIPIISRLASKLNAHRTRQGNPISGPMFPNEAGKPMDLNNLLNRVILPALDVCAICRVSRSEHNNLDHDFKVDPLRPKWHGWHAFRRGLGTNLHRLGVPDKTIQAILRHANVSTTQTFYIKSVSEDAVAAMEKLDLALNDTVVTPFPASPASATVN